MLKFIGSGSCFNIKDGNNSAYKIMNNTMLLLDCGEDVFSKLVANNILNKNIKKLYVAVTHFHSDHVGSLSSLIFYCNYILGFKPILIYPENNDIISLLKIQGVENELYDVVESFSVLKGIDVTEKEIFKIGAIKVLHRDYVNAYAYEIYFKEEDKNIFYSGDINYCPFNNDYFLNDNRYDYIYIDTSLFVTPVHLNINDLVKSIPLEHRHKVTCMHLDSDELKELVINNGFKLPNK